VPRTAVRVVQRATRADGTRSGAVRSSACVVRSDTSTPRYRCGIRLAPGTWVLTTEAWSATSLLDSAERRVVVRAARAPVVAEPVTG
jgi:hypothetical protein